MRAPRLSIAEQGALPNEELTRYLIQRCADFAVMTPEERKALPFREHSDYTSEAMLLNLRRNGTEPDRQAQLEAMQVEAVRNAEAARRKAQQRAKLLGMLPYAVALAVAVLGVAFVMTTGPRG